MRPKSEKRYEKSSNKQPRNHRWSHFELHVGPLSMVRHLRTLFKVLLQFLEYILNISCHWYPFCSPPKYGRVRTMKLYPCSNCRIMEFHENFSHPSYASVPNIFMKNIMELVLNGESWRARAEWKLSRQPCHRPCFRIIRLSFENNCIECMITSSWSS